MSTCVTTLLRSIPNDQYNFKYHYLQITQCLSLTVINCWAVCSVLLTISILVPGLIMAPQPTTHHPHLTAHLILIYLNSHTTHLHCLTSNHGHELDTVHSCIPVNRSKLKSNDYHFSCDVCYLF